ncbi:MULTISPECIES: DUF6153 family protein [Frankia]|uniref:DUF6153 family protein n=1 Tax=Frankia TaxID=1854 RepID=UPI0021183CF4|nr:MULTISPECIES: DUF6153 family protein [Frankia]
MSARPHGKTVTAGLAPFLLVVPVLLGILLMHGGLSTHLGHDRHATITEQAGASVMHEADVPASPAASSATHPRQRQVMTPSTTGMGHDGHGGEMCLAFLRLMILLVVALLLTRFLSSTSVRRAALRTASPRRGRAPPSRPAFQLPLRLSLCVLRL